MMIWDPVAAPDLHRYCGNPDFLLAADPVPAAPKRFIAAPLCWPTSIGFNDSCLWDAQPRAKSCYVLAWLHNKLQWSCQNGPATQQPAVSLQARLQLHRVTDAGARSRDA